MRRTLFAEVIDLSSINTSDVISVLKEEISDFDVKMTAVDEGSIISMGDGIVTVYGLSNAMYGELVIFETGSKRHGSGAGGTDCQLCAFWEATMDFMRAQRLDVQEDAPEFLWEII